MEEMAEVGEEGEAEMVEDEVLVEGEEGGIEEEDLEEVADEDMAQPTEEDVEVEPEDVDELVEDEDEAPTPNQLIKDQGIDED